MTNASRISAPGVRASLAVFAALLCSTAAEAEDLLTTGKPLGVTVVGSSLPNAPSPRR